MSFLADPALPDQSVHWSRVGGCRLFAMEEDMRNAQKKIYVGVDLSKGKLAVAIAAEEREWLG